MNHRHIFLLIGQSNMAGRGRLADVEALSHPEIHMFRDGQWMTACEPLHTDKPAVAGVGLAMRFAMDLLERANIKPIGLIPCAVGGTPLERWMPGADLYENAVATTSAALAQGKLRGILWHQGEADSGAHETASTYGQRLATMIQSLRHDLDAPQVPFVSGQLSDFHLQLENNPCRQLVNNQLLALGEQIPFYACVSTAGLTHNGDHLHFDAISLREIGHRYANAYLQMTAAHSTSA